MRTATTSSASITRLAVIFALASLAFSKSESARGLSKRQIPGNGLECASSCNPYTNALQACSEGTDATCLCTSANQGILQSCLNCLSNDTTGLAQVGASDAINFNDMCKDKGVATITANGPVATAFPGATLPGGGAGSAAPTGTPAAAGAGSASGSAGAGAANGSPGNSQDTKKSAGSANIESVGLSAFAALVLVVPQALL